MLTSSRRGIVYPNPTRVDTADVPRDFLAVINALEIDVIYGQGTLAARPAFGLQGRIYEATDQTPKLFFWDNGSGWDPMGGVAVGTVRGSDGADVQREILQGTIRYIDLSSNVKPSGGAAAGTEALRALGTTASTAAAGNDARLSDTRTPSSLSVSTGTIQAGAVTDAKITGPITNSKLATIPVIGETNAQWRMEQIITNSGITSSRSVTFPVAFSATPFVSPAASPYTMSPPNATIGQYDLNITALGTSGFTWPNAGASGNNFTWIAYGLA